MPDHSVRRSGPAPLSGSCASLGAAGARTVLCRTGGPRDVCRAYLPRLSQQAAGAERHRLQGESGLLPRYPELAVRIAAGRRLHRRGGEQPGPVDIERDRQENRHAGRDRCRRERSRKRRVAGGARQQSPPLRTKRATYSRAGLRHGGAQSRERQRKAHQPVAGGARGQRAVKLVTYNIQYGLGKDNRYDLARIAREVEDADVIALQEVERHWQRSGCVDSPAVLAGKLPEHYWVYGANLDMDAS